MVVTEEFTEIHVGHLLQEQMWIMKENVADNTNFEFVFSDFVRLNPTYSSEVAE